MAISENVLTCNQSGCGKPSIARFTWPGDVEDVEKGICPEHLPKLKAIAGAMGLPLQVIPLDVGDVRSVQPELEERDGE